MKAPDFISIREIGRVSPPSFQFGIILCLFSINLLLSTIVLGNKEDSLLLAITEYKESEQDSLLIEAMLELTSHYLEKDNILRASKLASNAFTLAKDNPYFEGRTIACIGIIEARKGNRKKAIESLNRALRLSTETNDEETEGAVLYKLAELYHLLDNDSNALHLNLRALTVFQNTNDKKAIAEAYIQRANLLMDDDPEKALSFLNKAQRILAKTQYYEQLIDVYQGIADYSESRNNRKKTLEYHKKAYTLATKHHFRNKVPFSAFHLGRDYINSGNMDSALFYINQGIEIGEAENDHFAVLDGLKLLFDMKVIENDLEGMKGAFDRYSQYLEKMIESHQMIDLGHTGQADMMNEGVSTVDKQEYDNRVVILEVIVGILLALILAGAIIFTKRLNDERENHQLLHIEAKRINQEIEVHRKELVEKNKSLEELTKEKDDLMQLLAHDLRTPLSSISSLNELIKLEGDLNVNQLKYNDLINKVIESGLMLINDILNLYHNRSLNKIEINCFDIARSIRKCIEKSETLSTQRHITIAYSGPNKLECRINKDLFGSIIDNLLSNAIKYSPENTRVNVSLTIETEDIHIRVEDEGFGFRDEELEHVFKKFTKFERPVDNDNISSGIGLYLTKIYTEKLGGNIELETTWKKGSVFTVMLPYRKC